MKASQLTKENITPEIVDKLLFEGLDYKGETADVIIVLGSRKACDYRVPLAAKLMKKSKEWVMQGLRDGVFPWGYAVKLTNWSYFISSVKFTEYTGIEVPLNEVA